MNRGKKSNMFYQKFIQKYKNGKLLDFEASPSAHNATTVLSVNKSSLSPFQHKTSVAVHCVCRMFK